jgi:ADP-ribose pyrophosphatase YjhB (NUDIX family)
VPPVRFCSACGAALATQPPVTCTACGTSHWLNPKPCANAVVVGGDRVLLVKRAHAPWEHAWCAPGGFCEAGEHPLETVEREVLEETGYRVEAHRYLGVWVDAYADEPAEADATVINVAYYLAAPADTGGAPVDPAEVSDVAWFAWDELPAELAPPGRLEAVLAAARRALAGEHALWDRRVR